LAIDASLSHRRLLSTSVATKYVSWRAASISVAISASLNRIAWNSPIGWPNAIRFWRMTTRLRVRAREANCARRGMHPRDLKPADGAVKSLALAAVLALAAEQRVRRQLEIVEVQLHVFQPK